MTAIVAEDEEDLRVFQDRVLDEFSAAVGCLTQSTRSNSSRDFINRRLGNMLFTFHPRERDANERMIRALYEGLKSGAVVVSREEDRDAFFSILYSSTVVFAPAIVRYIERGEIMEIMRQTREEIRQNTAKKKLLKLFVFDMEHDITNLPLEIRMSLSGFNDPVGYADVCTINGYRCFGLDDVAHHFRILWEENRR